MKARFAFFFIVLFASATSAHAQANCSVPVQSPLYNFYQTPPGASNASSVPHVDPCPTNFSVNTVSYTVSTNQIASCQSTVDGSTYQSSNRMVFGYGIAYCSMFRSQDYLCDPQFYSYATTATSASDKNRFYLQAFDDEPGTGTGCLYFGQYSWQDTWQCPGLACPTGGGGCPKLYNCAPDDPNPCCPESPIILDLSGQGFFLTNAKNGVVFDISGTGHPIQMAWTAPGADNGFLCLPGSDGRCANGKELFGNFTPQPKSSGPNGFAALAVYDLPQNGGNGNGMIDPGDAIFSSLRIWIDANHDGISQPEELHTLQSVGVYSISLKYHEAKWVDQYGNQFRYKSQVNPDDPDPSHVGKTAYDVFFLPALPAGTACTVPHAIPRLKPIETVSSKGSR